MLYTDKIWTGRRIFAAPKQQSMANLLEIKGIVKDYDGHRALSGVSIDVEQGKIFGLLGPNGAGKTTLIRIVNQIIGLDAGEVLFRGQPLKELHTEQIGYLPEERGLYKKMRVGEQLMYLAQLKGMSRQDARKELDQWFERLEITGWWDKQVDALSKGMQQKLQFIATVVHRPELLIFDEPFSGFDPVNAELIKQEILALRANGATIIFSTHNMSSVEEICDEIALLNRSHKILSGEVREIKSRFRSNIYNVEFSGQYDHLSATLTSNYEILKQSKQGVHTAVQLRLLAEDMTTNDLLRQLMQWGTIAKFEEQLPSMHDIFIQSVANQSPTPNTHE